MSSPTAPQILIKQPNEKRQFSMDFTNLLNTGETISSIRDIDSQTIGGAVSDLTISSSGINGSTVTFWIENGSDKTRYRIEVQVNTSSSGILEGDGILKVSDK